MKMIASKATTLQFLFIISSVPNIKATEDSYLRFIKDGCYLRGEALSCVKYKAIKITRNTIFGEMNNNRTIIANAVISFVPLDEEAISNLTIVKDEMEIPRNEPRSFLSEWTEIAKYFVNLVKDFFRMRGLKVNLPEGARTIEDQEADDGRGKKKRLAIMIPMLNLLATLKTKMLLIPILLAVMLIKKLLLVAALLLPSLLSTLKACKHHHPMTHYSYFGSDTSDYNSEYNNNYAYSSGGGYGKDWPSNRAYTISKHRPTTAPVYITAPGAAA